MATRYPSRESQDSDRDDSRDPSKASPIVELSSPPPDRTRTTPPMCLVSSAKHGTDEASPHLPRDAGRRTFPSILIDRGTTRYSLLTDDDPPEDDINRTIRGLHIIEGAGRNIIMDSSLKFSEQCSVVVKSANQTLGLIKRTVKSRDKIVIGCTQH